VPPLTSYCSPKGLLSMLLLSQASSSWGEELSKDLVDKRAVHNQRDITEACGITISIVAPSFHQEN